MHEKLVLHRSQNSPTEPNLDARVHPSSATSNLPVLSCIFVGSDDASPRYVIPTCFLPAAPSSRTSSIKSTVRNRSKLVTQLYTVQQLRVLRHSMLLLLLPGVRVLLSAVSCVLGGGHPRTRLLALPGETAGLSAEHDFAFLWL